jgi:hypothetical protein
LSTSSSCSKLSRSSIDPPLTCDCALLWGRVPFLPRRYVAYKHHQLLFLDILGGLYQLGIAAALTKRALWAHPATWVLLLMTLIKALPHVPLLLGYKAQHIRCAWCARLAGAAAAAADVTAGLSFMPGSCDCVGVRCLGLHMSGLLVFVCAGFSCLIT